MRRSPASVGPCVFALAAPLAIGLPGALAQCGAAAWSLVDADMPQPMSSPAMTYHAGQRKTILFGGMIGLDWPNVIASTETLAYDGTQWTLLNPPTGSPFPRYQSPMAYDSARKRLVMHAGAAVEWAPNIHHIPGTWEFDGERWFQITPTGPLARHVHQFVYDKARAVSVLIHGKHNLDDVWEYSGTGAGTWTFRTTGSMASRAWAGAAYDEVRQKVVVYGGYADNFSKLGDTWEWDGTAWALRNAGQAQPAGPGTRNGIAMVWDAARERVVMVGGESLTAQHGDAWSWDGSSWTLIPAPGLPPRVNHALAYDTHRSRVILATGVRGANSFGGTYELITDPRIDAAAPDVTVDVGQNAAMTVAASGTGTLAYEWRKGNVPLLDGGRYSGTASPTLLVTGARQIDTGEYSVWVTGPCGSRTRSHATLTVVCRGDLDGGGGVNTSDLTAFLAIFGQSVGPGSPADFNADGVINTVDLVGLLSAFGSEC